MTLEAHKDRSLGLVVFGVIEILIGGLTALLIPLVLAVTLFAPLAVGEGTSASFRSVVPSLVLYGLMAASFIWIGIGSVRARKWARAVMLSLSWLWLITGIVAMVLFWWILPRYWHFAGMGGLPDDTMTMVMLTTSLFLGFIYILLPLAFVLFYRSPHVIATCEARDRTGSWVDDCPSQVVSLVLVYAVGAVSCLLAPAYHFVFPLFGVVIDGWVGAPVWLAVLAVLIYLVVATPRRDKRSWTVAMWASVVGATSSTLSAALVPYSLWLDRMALPVDQREMMAAFGEPTAATMVALSLVSWGTWIGFLLSVRRFFGPAKAQ